jgi:PRTRC genetic system protein B
MNDVSALFSTVYQPTRLLVIYEQVENDDPMGAYVESFDIGPDGCPLNAHPLTLDETRELASILAPVVEAASRNSMSCFQPAGLLPETVLWMGNRGSGNGVDCAIWHTPPGRRMLYFADALDLQSGTVPVPALVWVATRDTLSVFALNTANRPTLTTQLYKAPFFNIDTKGRVCLGTVAVNQADSPCLETFIGRWESYFFDSYFSHLLDPQPVVGNAVPFWETLTKQARHNPAIDFPLSALIETPKTLKTILPA